MLDGSFLSYINEVVTIMRPIHSVVPRGLASPEKNQPTVSIRLTRDARDDINIACGLLDLPRSEFIRWCAHLVALDIIKQKERYDKEVLGLKTPL